MRFPFIITQGSEQLIESYPDPNLIKNIFSRANAKERLGILRLWMTEGIPYAFKDLPLLYEETREFIARDLRVNSKEITIVGSGRIGYSLKKKVWGKTFSANSDLDFTIVSNDLFTKLVIDYQLWVSEIRAKKIIPRDATQMKNWLASIGTLDRNIPNGYINTNDIFSHQNYPTVKRCYTSMIVLRDVLKLTPHAPQISKTSVRVYSSWNSCIRQLEINFKTALELW
jgi:hypothetical protein